MDSYKQPPSPSFDRDAWRAPPSVGSQTGGAKGWLAIALAVVAAAPLGYGLKYAIETQQRRAAAGDRAGEEEGKAFIAARLRDPSSAQFRSMDVYDHCVLGEVNGKNAFGAYAGFGEFYYDRRTKKGEIEPSSESVHLTEADRLREALNRSLFMGAQAACLHRDSNS